MDFKRFTSVFALVVFSLALQACSEVAYVFPASEELSSESQDSTLDPVSEPAPEPAPVPAPAPEPVPAPAPEPAPAPAPMPISFNLMSAQALPASVEAGQVLRLSAHLRATGSDSNLTVRLEFRNSLGTVTISQRTFVGEMFSDGQTRIYDFDYMVPSNTVAGPYCFSVGVFNSTGATTHHWTACAVTIQVSSPPPSPVAVTEGTYTIRALHSNRFMDVTGSSHAEGAQIIQWDFLSGQTNQHFGINHVGGNQYQLIAAHSGMCAGIESGSLADGGLLKQYKCAYQPSQNFNLLLVADGTYQVRAIHSGKCLVSGSTATGGESYFQATCNANSTNQRFTLTSVGALNLVGNPGFEFDMAAWQTWDNSLISASSFSGARALQTGTGAGGAGQDITAKLVPGRNYRLTVQAQVSSTSVHAGVGIKFWNGNTVVYERASAVKNLNYQLHTVDITAPATFTLVEVYSWKEVGTNYLYTDDFTLAPR